MTAPSPDEMVRAELSAETPLTLSGMARQLSGGAIGGLVCGAVIGGVGGRLAMFVLRFTSSSNVIGLETDDGFRVGSFTTDTIFLVLFTAIIGMIGGVAYLVTRRFLPSARRGLWTALFVGVVGGSAIVEPGGVDFTLLDPLWLAVVLFVALPAVYGWALSETVERLLARQARSAWSWIGVVPVLALLVVWPLAIAIVVFGVGSWWIGNRYPGSRLAWRSGVVTWFGRALLVGGGALALWELVDDAKQIVF